MNLAGETILYLNNFSGTGLGGGEIHMRSVLTAAHDAGARVVLACHPGSDVETEFRALGVEIEPVRLHVADLPGSIRRVRRIAGRVGARVVHSNGWLTNVVSRLARDDLDLRIVNSVLVDPDAPTLAGAGQIEQTARNAIDRSTFRHADALVPITRAVADKLLELGADSDRVRVIPGSVDVIALRDEATAEAAGFVRERGIVYVGMIGRLEAVKGVETFVRAAGGLVAAGVTGGGGNAKVRFVIGGAGSLESELREIAVAHGLTEHLQFLGAVDSAAATFDAMDIVVVPSLSEGFGIVAAEAMALGKPVIASRVGGLPEVVEDRVTGLLVEAGDASALALAIEELLGDPERCAAMGEAGRARALSEFSTERMSSAYVELYESLLGL